MQTEECYQLILRAMNGHHGEDQERIARIGIRWLAMIIGKNIDYGSAVWKAPKLLPKASPRDGILVRMSDKIERIESLQANGGHQIAETLDDTIDDLGAYCLLYRAAPEDTKNHTGRDNGTHEGHPNQG